MTMITFGDNKHSCYLLMVGIPLLLLNCCDTCAVLLTLFVIRRQRSDVLTMAHYTRGELFVVTTTLIVRPLPPV